MLAYFSTTFGKLTVSADFDASRVERLTRGLAGYFRSRMLRSPGAMWRLGGSASIYARRLADYDVLLAPVVGHTTPKLGHLSPSVEFETLPPRLRNFVSFSPLNNATGSPAMSLPLGATADGLPIGWHTKWSSPGPFAAFRMRGSARPCPHDRNPASWFARTHASPE